MAEKKTKKLKSTANDDIVKVAAVQMASSPNVSANLVEAKRLIEMAAKAGAKLVVLPEYFCIMGLKDFDKVAIRENPMTAPFSNF